MPNPSSIAMKDEHAEVLEPDSVEEPQVPPSYVVVAINDVAIRRAYGLLDGLTEAAALAGSLGPQWVVLPLTAPPVPTTPPGASWSGS